MGWFFVTATAVYLLSQRCEYLIRFVGCIRLHSHIVRYTVNSNTVRLQWTLDFCTMFALITYATYDIAGLVLYLRIIIFKEETSLLCRIFTEDRFRMGSQFFSWIKNFLLIVLTDHQNSWLGRAQIYENYYSFWLAFWRIIHFWKKVKNYK